MTKEVRKGSTVAPPRLREAGADPAESTGIGCEIHLLIIDDEGPYRRVLEREFSRRNHRVTVFSNARQALEEMQAKEADVILLDLNMPGMTGIEFLEELRKRGDDAEVVILTGYPSLETAVEALRKGAYDYLTKPVDLSLLERVVERAAERRILARENHALRRALSPPKSPGRLSSASPQMQKLLGGLPRLAMSESTILVQGDTGTGKEVVAREIHRLSRRADQPFVVIDCASLQPSVRGSELFGHERGAFTGADRARPGLFEAAHKGTVFLDEVGELDPESQAALLRVLENSEIRRVGSTRSAKIDVRVLAATHRDLAEKVSEGAFREDLLYRLHVLQVRLPPLRERTEDLIELFDGFLSALRPEADRPTLSEQARQILAGYAWPGNIRELRNLAELVAATVDGPTVQVSDLPPRIVSGGPTQQVDEGDAEGITLKEIERRHILAAFERNGRNKRAAAEELGISVRTLYNKLAEYEAESPTD